MKGRVSLFLAGTWILLWALLSLWANTFTADDFNLPRSLTAPTVTFSGWSGTDAFGRTLIECILRGSFVSLSFSLGAVVICVVVSTLFGIVTAFSPAWAQKVTQLVLEFFIGIPGLVLALSIAAVNGPGWTTLLLALILGILPSLARLIQSRTRELILEGYLQASIALGASRIHIARQHLVRALSPVITAKLPQIFAHCLLAEATLTFLGVGAPLGHETWGALLAQGRDYLLESPQIAAFSGLPLVLTLLSIQTVGDRLSHGRNPRFQG